MRASATSLSPHRSTSGARSNRDVLHAWQSDAAITIAFFILAFAARLIFLFNSPDREWPHSAYYEGDAIVWVEWAKAIDEGGVFQFDLPIHPPAVAYAIAYLSRGVQTTGFISLKVLWCAMSAAACAFTFLACAENMRRRIAVIAALLLTFSFGQYVLATSLNNETPYVMLLTMIVWLTQRAIAQPARWTIIALGVAHGFAMLSRAEHPLLLGMFLLWILIARVPQTQIPDVAAGPSKRVRIRAPSRARLLSATSIAFVALLMCLPWTVHATLATMRFNNIQPGPIAFNLAPVEWDESARAALNTLPAFARVDNFAAVNYFAQKNLAPELQGVPLNGSDVYKLIHVEFGWIPRPLPSFVLVSDQGPFSFALANHPDCDGGFSRGALAHPMRGKDPEFAFAFPPHNRVFIDGWRVGWEEIRSDPAKWRHIVVRKFQRFADGVTCGFGAANLPLGRCGVREPVDMFVSDSPSARWWQSLMLVLIATGTLLALARRIPCALWILLILNKLIITLLFYGYARQGASIAPAFYVFVAVTIDTLLLPLDRSATKLMRRQAAAAIIMCVLALGLDVGLSRRHEHVEIVGQRVPRPDLGPGAFQAFNRVEIRSGL